MSDQAFTDQYGTGLTIVGESALPGCARVGVSERCGAHIPAEDFPRLTTALYAAAGRPEPVILDRPKCPSASLGIGVGYAIRADGQIEVTRQPQSGVSGTAFHPDGIRCHAASLAILADEAETLPDPAEVEELAALMDAEMDRRGNGQFGLYPAVARIALQWMNGRQQREGEQL